MSLENVANTIVGLIFLVLISAILICLGLAGYFYLTETPVPPTAEEIQKIETEHQQYRSNKAANICFAALGSFILGWLTGKAQFHTVGLCLIVGALAWDYKTVTTALFLWYFIVPSIVIMAIVGLFKRN